LTIGYARGAGGEDIDFLVGGMGHAPIAIESKHAASVDPGVLRKATAAAERFGVRQLLLVSRAPEAGRQVFGPMVVRTVPLWRFLMWPEAALREGDDG
jgi:hypothetical protein